MTPKPLLLASQSPRRQHMLRWLGIAFDYVSAEVDERQLPGEPPQQMAARLARLKAQTVRPVHPAAWILAADTVVDLAGRALGKPANADEAGDMLRQLRNGPHQVHTGIALAVPGQGIAARIVTTHVTMRSYTDAEIEAYIATGDPLDKAGAYAIQHAGFHPVARLDVCYTNVVGLPLYGVLRLLKDAGYSPVLEVDVPALCRLHFGYSCPNPDEGVPL